MTTATISLVGSEDSRCMGAAFRLKTAYRDGTTHVVFERGGLPPLDFMAKLAALVPRPRTNLTGPPTDDFMECWHGAAFRRIAGTVSAHHRRVVSR